MSIYKIIDLFGNEEVLITNSLKKKENLFTKYDKFVEKFDAKKTTDDCYTPDKVFQIVLNYVSKKFNLSNKKIIRPFYPNGDFEAIDYQSDNVVIDNPPFSIISKICRFYIEKNVPFFLFAPHLTLFSSDIDCTHIVVGGDITYTNGATVKTSFLSNMFGDAKIIGDAELYEKFKKLSQIQKANLPKYEYPNHVVTVYSISYIVEKGISLVINKESAKHCRALSSQKKHGKGIFGSGFLVSEKAAAEKDYTFIWELSEKEKNIISKLL